MIACTRGPWRYGRSVALGLLVGVLSIVGHTFAAGPAPSVWSVLMVLGLALAVAAAVTGRRLTVPVVLSFAVLFQAVAHFIFDRFGHAGGHPAHVHMSHVPLGTVESRLPMVERGAHPLVTQSTWPLDFTMIAAHLIIALAATWLVLRAEAALFGLAAAVARTARVIFGGTPYVALPPVAWVPLPLAPLTPPAMADLESPLQRRGPPLPV